MVDTFVGTKEEDFITRLLRLINKGNKLEAITQIKMLKTTSEKLFILEQLAEVVKDGDSGLTFRLQVELTLAANFELIHQLIRDNDPVHIRNHVRDLAFILVRAIESVYHLVRDPSSRLPPDASPHVVLTLPRNRAYNRLSDRTLAFALGFDSTSLNTIIDDLDHLIVIAVDLVGELQGYLKDILLIAEVASDLFDGKTPFIPINDFADFEEGDQRHIARGMGIILDLQQQKFSPILDTVAQVLQNII